MQKKNLSQLTQKEIKTLESMGVLHELYPSYKKELPSIEKYNKVENILNLVLASYDKYDIIKIKTMAREWLNEYKA